MMLDDILAGLSVTEQEQVTTKLQSLARHCALTLQAVHNLNAETRLSEECWRLLVQNLLGAADVNAQHQAITVALRQHTLRGPEVSASRFGVLGRAVSVRAFVH